MVRRRLVRLAATIVVLALADAAEAAKVKVRWLPSSDARVTGYNVYVRSPGRFFGTARNAGLPPRAGDGTHSHVVTGLTGGQTYHFTVTAYTATKESAIAEEMTVGATDPCLEDHCYTFANCRFGPVADGKPCDDDLFCNGSESCDGGVCTSGNPPQCNDFVACTVDSCDESIHACRFDGPPGCCSECSELDPCVSEACRTGDCTTSHGDPLATRKLKIRASEDKAQLIIRGTFQVPGGVDPLQTGLTLEIFDDDGGLVYRAAIPSNAITAGRVGSRYRFSASHSEAVAVGGLTSLGLKLKNDTWFLIARAEAAHLANATGESHLTWALRFADEVCVRDMRVPCSGVRDGLAVCIPRPYVLGG
jgi:hypothetical protein